MNIRRWSALALVAAACVAVAQPAPDAPPPPVAVRVGTWNIEWLGCPDKRKLPRQEPADLAAYLTVSGVDVVSLNEISITTQPVDGVGQNAVLEKALAILSQQPGQRWQHAVFAKDDPADRDQCLAIAWNAAKLTPEGKPFRVPLRKQPGQDVWTRHPWAMKFSAGPGRTDFVLVPIHMKSNRGGEEVTRQRRAAEATALGRALASVQLAFSDDDIVLLGDFNALRHDEPALLKFAALGFRDLNAGDMKSWIKSGPFDYAPFDRLLVPDDQPEFRNARQRVFTDHPFAGEADYRRRCSDHYLAFMDVLVMADDD